MGPHGPQCMAQQGPKRFNEGETLFARLADGWHGVSVIANDSQSAAYKLRVTDSGEEVYAPMDQDLFVRKTMPNKQEQAEMQGQIKQMQQMQQQMMKMKQQQMQQQMQGGGQQQTGTMIDRGATVPDGPLAVEQVLLVNTISQHRMMAMDEAAKCVMTKKQIKTLTRAQEKAKTETDQGRMMNIMQKAQHEVQSQLSDEQKKEIQQKAQEKMAEIQQQILGPQERAWLDNLDEEQRQVWNNTQEVAKNADPQSRMQLIRRGQLKVGKMLSEEQQVKMAATMKEIRENFMKTYLEKQAQQIEEEAAEEEDAAAQMMEAMELGF